MHNSLNLYNLLEENPVLSTSTQTSGKHLSKLDKNRKIYAKFGTFTPFKILILVKNQILMLFLKLIKV